MRHERPIGNARANTVLVVGVGCRRTAVLASVVVTALPYGDGQGDPPPDDLVRVIGPVALDDDVLAHVREVIAPLVNRILEGLNQRKCRFEISIVKIDAAAALDLPTRISGHSADVAMFAAMLGAAINISPREDAVMTGAISSVEGDVGLVSSLDAKLFAAEASPSNRVFIYPRLDRDGSLPRLAPDEYERGVNALSAVGRQLETIAVSHVGELIPLVFRPRDIVAASLRRGFYLGTSVPTTDSSPVADGVRFLAQDNTRRFWREVEHLLLEADSDSVRALFELYVDYHVRSGGYPSGSGETLRQLVCSIPPVTRRQKIRFPLVSVKSLLTLGTLAPKGDEEDALAFLDAVCGRHLNRAAVGPVRDGARDRPYGPLDVLGDVLEAISHEALTQRIGIPLDTARGLYWIDQPTAGSHEEFHDIITSFYLHLIRHGGLLPAPADADMVAADAWRLVEDAFGDQGGGRAAEVEARRPYHGGLRLVLDRMTDRLGEELKFKHVDRILKEAVDPFSAADKVAFMEGLMKHIGELLPPDIRSRPATDFVERRDDLIRAYVRARDRLAEAFRSI